MMARFNDTFRFLSTPSARRATRRRESSRATKGDFYPRPPRGGRLISLSIVMAAEIFLSTPSARRATHPKRQWPRPTANFYPRPPRGGRQGAKVYTEVKAKFLSTPSARRATSSQCRFLRQSAYFYPRPPRGGRHGVCCCAVKILQISIHALREEGDSKNRDKISIFKQIVQHSARI